MDPTRWQQIQDLFHAAVEQPPDSRRGFVTAAAGADDALAASVLRLLDADAGDAFLDRDVGAVAGRVLDASAPAVGMQVGPYRLTAPLGEGGTGVVYLATRADIGHEVAIKLLRDAWVSAHRRERFLQEQRTLARLDHPAIARILDAGVLDGGTPWFAMERVEGLPLDEYCRRHVKDVAQMVRLMRTIVAAVQHAHARLIIHRDLKPSNIAVTPDGQPKLLDFGIARQLEQASSAAQTGPLRVLTPGYASPEELRGEASGVQADVYSLGVVLREQLALVTTQPRPVSGWLSGRAHHFDRVAGRDLDLIVAIATEPDPTLRYATAGALMRDLDAWLDGRPLAARSPSAMYRAGRFASRHRRSLAAAALVLAIGGGVATVYARRLAEARDESVQAAERAERLLRFLQGLFDGGQGDGAAPVDLRVVSMLDRGLREAEQLGDDPIAQAEMFDTLGQAYLDLGSLDRADQLLTSALALRRRRLAEAPAEVVRALAALSGVRLAQDRPDEGERLASEAAALAASRLAPAHAATLDAQLALGRAQEIRGNYAAAAATVEAALAAHEGADAQVDRQRARGLATLSDTYFYTGDLDRSADAARRAMAITERLRGASHPDVGHMAINLGAIALNRVQLDESERHYRQAVQVFEAWYGAEHPETASALTNLAQTMSRQSRPADALPLLERALATQQRVYGPTHRRTAFVQNELGLVLLRLNDYLRAETAFEQAVAGYRLAQGTRFQEGVSIVNLATVYLNRGDAVRAERELMRALAIYAESLPPDHLRVGIARGRLGRALLRQGRGDEARRALQDAERILVARDADPAFLQAVRDDLASLR